MNFCTRANIKVNEASQRKKKQYEYGKNWFQFDSIWGREAKKKYCSKWNQVIHAKNFWALFDKWLIYWRAYFLLIHAIIYVTPYCRRVRRQNVISLFFSRKSCWVERIMTVKCLFNFTTKLFRFHFNLWTIRFKCELFVWMVKIKISNEINVCLAFKIYSLSIYIAFFVSMFIGAKNKMVTPFQNADDTKKNLEQLENKVGRIRISFFCCKTITTKRIVIPNQLEFWQCRFLNLLI